VSKKNVLFKTPYLFSDPREAVDFFNANREPELDAITGPVAHFLVRVAEYDPEALFNVQTGYKSHYVMAAREGDHHGWLFAKPTGLAFDLGHERNVEAMMDMWPEQALEPPYELAMPRDVWFEPAGLGSLAAEVCLRIAAAWGVRE